MDAIKTIPTKCKSLIKITRLVDDVNYIFNGRFDDIIETLKHFGSMYPDIVLNVQLSPRFSSFLDYKIYNLFYGQNKLITSLSRKELNNYNYVPPSYKGYVVESTLHRIDGRCTEKGDKLVQKQYLMNIMRSKNYSTTSFVFDKMA